MYQKHVVIKLAPLEVGIKFLIKNVAFMNGFRSTILNKTTKNGSNFLHIVNTVDDDFYRARYGFAMSPLYAAAFLLECFLTLKFISVPVRRQFLSNFR